MIIKTNLANPRGIHTHCQVARKAKRTSQNLSKSMAAPSRGKSKLQQNWKINDCKYKRPVGNNA
jgi:hypothetical protein